MRAPRPDLGPTVTGARILDPDARKPPRRAYRPAATWLATRLAQVAAVIGRSFPLPVLEHLIASDDLEADLSALLRADIIREVRHYPEAIILPTRTAAVREASLDPPPARRRELHGAVAAAFETQFATTLDDHLEVLAHHYARSEDLAKALDYLERAGEKAAALDATPHAAEPGAAR